MGDPGANKESEDEDPISPVLGEIIKAATGQVSFGNVITQSEEGQRGERGRIDPGRKRC